MANPTAGSILNNPSHSMLHNSYHNVKAYGAIGDGVANDTAALQAGIDAAQGGMRTLFLPTGTYKITSTLVISSHVSIVGGPATIQGNIAGPLIQKTTGTNHVVTLKELGLVNQHAAGTGVSLTGIIAPCGLYHCGIVAYQGLVLTDPCFTTTISDCRFVGPGSSGTPSVAGSIGINAQDHTNIYAADVVGYETGIYSTGLGVVILGGRIEVNKYGIMVAGIGTGTISGLTFEGCDYGISLASVGGTTVSGCMIQGTTNAPSGQSLVGIDVTGTYGCNIAGIQEGGTHSTAFVRASGTHRNLNIVGVYADVGAFSLGDITGITLTNCQVGSTAVPDITRAPVIARASLPAAATQQDGRLVIDDNGAGDRNLMIYAGGQRFRIDGGANV